MAGSFRAVDKEIFLESLICPARGWFIRHETDAATPSPGQMFRMTEGREVHRRARAQFPEGVFASAKEGTSKVTAELIANPTVPTIFEARFEVEGLVARADILRRLPNGGFELIEIKSNVNLSVELLADAAYSVMVAIKAGVRIDRVSILLLSRDYRLGMTDDHLFAAEDCTEDVLKMAAEFATVAPGVVARTGADHCPPPRLLLDCRSCAFFEDRCLGKGVNGHILDLPRLSAKKLALLEAMGTTRIADIPDAFDLTDIQATIRQAVTDDAPVIDHGQLLAGLEAVVWPAAFLDFETCKWAIPIYPGIAPHEQIPTQYSIHYCSGPGSVTSHREYLADAGRDCRHDLAQSLCSDLQEAKTIVAYSGYEKRVLNDLAKACVDLAALLQDCVGKLFDLEKLLKPPVYYHPGFKGRSSIKATLPVMVKDLGYEGLSIGDGDTAIAMFARMAEPDCSDRETGQIRKNLLDYCRTDTLAMVRLHDELTKIRSLAT